MNFAVCRNLLLFFALGCGPCFATTLSEVFVQGPVPGGYFPLCDNLGPASASCAASDKTGSGAASATSTWGAPGGVLHFVGNTRSDLVAAGYAQFDGSLIVNGVSGTGNLELAINGFSANSTGDGTPGTLIAIQLEIGSNLIAPLLPGGPPSSTITATVPVPFGTPIIFHARIDASASSVMFHDGTWSQGTAEALADYPTFTVLDNAGHIIPGATVSIAPEPSTLLSALCGFLLGFLLLRNRTPPKPHRP